MIIAAIAAIAVITAMAQDYVVIGHEGYVFDKPNSKSYITTNQMGENVELLPGMVFRCAESRDGWDLIEYTPGLRGFILKAIESGAGSLGTPVPGVYPVANKPGSEAKIEANGSNWTATLDGVSYSGAIHDGALVFFDSQANPALSLVVSGGQPIVFSYDNSLTRFF